MLIGFNLPGTWKLDHIHVHWGEDDSKGSEHYLDGKQYAAEVCVIREIQLDKANKY